MNPIQNSQHEKLKSNNKTVDSQQDIDLGDAVSIINGQITTLNQNIVTFTAAETVRLEAIDNKILITDANIASNLVLISDIRSEFEAEDIALHSRITSEIATINIDYSTISSNLGTAVADFNAANILTNDIITQNKTELDAVDLLNTNSILSVRTDFEASEVVLNNKIGAFEYDLKNNSNTRLDNFLSQVDVNGITYNIRNDIESIVYKPVERLGSIKEFKESYTYNSDNLISSIVYTNLTAGGALIATATFTYDASKRLFSSNWVEA